MSDLPNGWSFVLFPDCVFFQEGPGLRKYQYRQSGIPFLNIRTFDHEIIDKKLCRFLDPKEVEDKYSHFLVDEGDILVAISGSIGKIAIARLCDLPLMLNTSIMRFRSLREDVLLTRYIYFFLKSEHFFTQAKKVWTGTAQKNMGPSHIKTFKLLLPPLNEQKRIVAKLDRLFAHSRRAREELTRIPQLIDRYKKAILAAACSGCLTSDYSKTKNWDEVKLENICNLKAGEFVSASDINSEKDFDLYSCFGGNGLRGYTKTYTHEGIFPLIGRQGALCGNVHIAQGKFHATEHAIVVSPILDIDVDWLYYQLTALNLNKYSTGMAQPGLSVKNIKSILVLLPSLGEQKEIVRRIQKLFKAVDTIAAEYQQAIKRLDRLDQAILAKAFRGELVPQDPTDEPAAALLARIQAEKLTQPKPAKAKRKPKVTPDQNALSL